MGYRLSFWSSHRTGKNAAVIRISPAQLKQITEQAQAAYPGECCGLLAGRADVDGSVTVSRVVASPNAADAAGNDRFEVSPKVRFDLMRALDGTDEAIIGHYHSHPDHPPQPSKTDLSMAFEAEMVWLITAVATGTAGETLAWRLDREANSVQAVALEVSQS